jgi:protein involved in polysaccharide export with SLBB domain
MFKKSVLVLMILSLSGCGLAPGMRMQSPSDADYYTQSKLRIEPTFVVITGDLIASMEVTQKDNYYYVAPEDVLTITVWNHPEFTSQAGNGIDEFMSQQTSGLQGGGGTGGNTLPGGGSLAQQGTMAGTGYLVNPDGNIFFPLLGERYVAGKTPEQIRHQFTALLSKYVRNPQVDVRVSVFRSHKVYVMGEVNHAGLQNITDIPITITDALSLAGGMNEDTADPSQIYVIRGHGNILKPTVYWLNAQSPDALLLGERFKLENNDIIFVSTATVSRWNRAISQIMPTIQTIFYTQASIQNAHT